MAMDKDGCVLTCTVGDCGYNRELECWAPEIIVGDDHPMCDTFTTEAVGLGGSESLVMRCQVGECHFNESMHCHARGITVDRHSGHADCITFRP